MSWLNAFARITVICDTCNTAQEEIDRDDVLPDEWTEGAERLLRIKLRRDGWHTYMHGTSHACPACAGDGS